MKFLLRLILKKWMLDVLYDNKSSSALVVAFILVVSVCSGCIVYAQDAYSFVKMWGSQGTYDGQFVIPSAIAADPAGNIYVIDYNNDRIQKFLANGTFVTKWGIQGSAPSQFNNPTGIAVDPVGNVLVNDPGNTRIQKFTADGNFITEWSVSATTSLSPITGPLEDLFGGGTGSEPDEAISFPSPPGIAVDPSGNVYVASSLDHKIKKFSTDGIELKEWGENGIGDGQFSFPSSLATDPSGNLYVFDSGNHRIQVFTSEGQFVSKWGSQGVDDGQFTGQSSSIAVDVTGNVYVADSGNNRIQKFDGTGSFVSKWGSQGVGDGQFNRPSGIAVDPSGNVYVADSGNNRIQVFSIARPLPS